MKFTIFILFTLFSIDIFAQPKDINVDGKVFGEDEAPLKNVLIEVYKNDSSYYKYRTEEKGEYHFNLPYNFNYTIVFSKNKYYSKIIDIKAEGITREDLSFAQKKIGEWQVFLFREVPGVDASIFDDAVGEIFFNEKTGLIDWNADYFESKRQDLIDFEQELKEKREEALQNRIENYSSGFEALNKNAKPFKENISKKYSLKVSEYYSKLTNAFESLPKTVKETFEQKDGYFVVLREVKIDGYEPVIFKKVVHYWGGKYYFRNGLSITDLQFELLTSTENDFAPSFDERK